MNALREILSPDFPLRNSVCSGVLTGAVAPLAGVYLVVGRRTMLALMLPQVSTAGVALTIGVCTVLGMNVGLHGGSSRFFMLAALGAAVAMAVALLWQTRVSGCTGSNDDADSAATYALASAMTLGLAASNLVPEMGLLGILHGESLAVTAVMLRVQALTYTAVVVIVFALWHPFSFLLFNPMLAYCAGLPSRRISATLTAVICLVIAIGGLCAGPLAVFGFLVTPVLIVHPFTHSLRKLVIFSGVIGAAAAFAGFYLSYVLEDWTLPVTAAQLLLLGALWVASRLLRLGMSWRETVFG